MISVDQKYGSWLTRGARPMSETDFAALAQFGIKTVIDLEAGWFEWFHNRAYQEDEWGDRFKVDVYHLPLSDFTAPSEDQVKQFLSVVDSALQKGDVYAHCLHGQDRTGYMIAEYRIKVQGWAPEKAIDEMLRLGFHKFPYWFWINSLR